MARSLVMLVLAALVGAGIGCYRGFDIEDKQPPPGHAGGTCVLDDHCYDPYACIVDAQVCYDPNDPCKGIYCSGNGTCSFDLDTKLPSCSCDVGFTNETYAYFCTPNGL